MKNDLRNKTGDMVKITMVHGLGSCTKRQIATATALGLHRPNDTRVLPKNPATLGACKNLEHLVRVEDCTGGAVGTSNTIAAKSQTNAKSQINAQQKNAT
ncbi:MAG: 50S ribosomal protein L30, partial [Christensenellaceae bacterium]|nr:50S ribosomal protein L30 [Christensenellaceae bacterium]